jgi:fatty acid desaturase
MADSAEHPPVAYHHGEMPVKDQRSTYTFFNSMVHWCATGIAAMVAFLVLWLCAHIAFLGALVVAVVIVAGGIWFNRSTGHNAGY